MGSLLQKKPEILSPAGNLEKLKTAILYGADAVYLGGQEYGLRSAAENFSRIEIEQAMEFAHKRGRKVYVVLNAFLHDEDMQGLDDFLAFLEKSQVDAVIVADLGVLRQVRKFSKIPIHLSTQASCLNYESALFWKEQGVCRIVLGRELSLQESSQIAAKAGLEVEIFIHGSMCMSYSGHCLISNFTQGRDSNRGGCAQSCRFEYSLERENGERSQGFFLSSKDLWGMRALPLLKEFPVHSLKIEGRMKSALYVGGVTKAYRAAIDLLFSSPNLTEEQIVHFEQELDKSVHRDFCTGNLLNSAGLESVYDERVHNGEKSDYAIAGMVLEVSQETNQMFIEVKNSFNLGQTLELLPFQGENIAFQAEHILNLIGKSLERTKPSSVIALPLVAGAEAYNIIRVRTQCN